MSAKLINHSADLKKLLDEGYTLEIKHGYLIVHDIPYVKHSKEIALGFVVSDLTLNNNQTIRPSNHQVWFGGEFPCDRSGKPIEALRHSDTTQTLCDGLIVNHRFSCKPKDGYANFYEKMTRYIEIVSNPAKSIDPSVSARRYKPIKADEDTLFKYADSASSRYGIATLSQKCAMNKIAIIGLGGTGAYLLDLLAKTHVQEIHLFDGDVFIQHNAFRAPGAASLKDLEEQPYKVNYYAGIYARMRNGIVPRATFIDEENISQIEDFDFVFSCVDNPAVKKIVFDHLISRQIPFIDTGMELEHIEESQSLIGACRATLCTPEKNTHLPKYISLRESAANDVYDSNIQVAEMNALNATMAVIRWKKYCGFYQDIYQELQTTYSINTHQLTRDEIAIADNQ